MSGKQLQTQDGSKQKNMQLAEYLMDKAEDFAAVAVVDNDRFMRMVKNALIRDPQIAEASAQSVYLECMKAAADGLVLDGREAVLTRFKSNKRQKNPQTGQWEDNWITEVVYIPMVAGIMKRVRNSGEIASWSVELVYAEEHAQGKFRYRAAPNPELFHEPIIVGERGEVVAAYSAVKLRDGSHHYEVMRRDQLEAIKNRTKSKRRKKVNNVEVEEITGPWATDEEEMFRKTVIRRHSKRLPVSSELLDVTRRIDGLYDMDPDNGEIDLDPAPAPAPVAKAKKASAASRLKQAAKSLPKPVADPKPKEPEDEENDEVPHDKETGEVLDGEVLDGEAGNGIDPGDEF